MPSSRRSSSSAGAGPGSLAGSSAAVSGAQSRSCATATLLQTLMRGLSSIREPRMVRERFEEDLRSLVRATSVSFRHDAPDAERPNVVSFELSGAPLEGWPRLEIERANGRWPLGSARSRSDGAAPLIGSSLAIRLVRDRIERVAASDFTALIEGGSGPQPHPSFIEVFCETAVNGGERQMEGAGEDGQKDVKAISAAPQPREAARAAI